MSDIIDIGVLRNYTCPYDNPRPCKQQKRAYLYLVVLVALCVLMDQIAIIPFKTWPHKYVTTEWM